MGELDKAIAAAVAEIEGVSALLVFGSRARGRPRPDSDLDVAVLPAGEVPGGRRRLIARIAVALAGLSPEGRVDVVLLDEAPELLRQRVFEGGVVLIDRDPARLRALRIATMREHGDREPYRRLLMEAQERRLTGREAGHG